MSEQSVDTAADDEPETLQSRLEEVDDEDPAVADVAPVAAADRTIADPAALLAYLDVTGHFHRDSRAGRVFHRGMVSLREDVPNESLHVSVDGNRVMAHVDEARRWPSIPRARRGTPSRVPSRTTSSAWPRTSCRSCVGGRATIAAS